MERDIIVEFLKKHLKLGVGAKITAVDRQFGEKIVTINSQPILNEHSISFFDIKGAAVSVPFEDILKVTP